MMRWTWQVWGARAARTVTGLTLVVMLPALAACPGQRVQPEAQTVVLVSLDGFHPVYLDRFQAPNLRALAARGVRARWMVPPFPANTFPSHYTIVTGLLPVHHGIVNNHFVDPTDNVRFRYSDTTVSRLSRWWLGEPLWVTAERQGVRAASFFWPGSDVNDPAKRPSRFKPFDVHVPDTVRVDTVLAWLTLPAAARPRFVTLYFSDVDHVGHDDGPMSDAVRDAVARVDAMVGRLVAGIRERGLDDRVNVVVVSDHGMAEVSTERTVFLDDYVDTARVQVVDIGQTIFLRPRAGTGAEAIARALAAAPHLQVYTREASPERWAMRGNPRVADIVGVSETGWRLATRARPPRAAEHGAHGFDNQDSTMRSLFIATGPAFRRGVVAEPFGNVHLYALMAHILGVTPAPNDGSLDSVRTLLR